MRRLKDFPKYLLALIMLCSAISTAEAQSPDWSVNASAFANRMSVVGYLRFDGNNSVDPDDLVAAFIGGEVRGVANPIYVQEIDAYVVFLLIFSNNTSGTISFKAYDSSEDKEVDMAQTVEFEPDDFIGGLETSFVWSEEELNHEASFISFEITSQTGATVIDGSDIAINASLAVGESLASQIASFEISEGATITLNEVEQVSGTTENDFSQVLTYSIQSEDLLTINEFEVSVSLVNEAPTDLSLDNLVIEENSGSNLFIGTLSTTDSDNGDSFQYQLVNGGADNSLFRISGSTLLGRSSFDHEESPTRTIRIRSSDSYGETIEKDLIITVEDVNETPSEIVLSNASIDENGGVDLEVATLSASDDDENESFTYSLVTGTGSADNSSFKIDGDKLLTTSNFNFESKSSLSIRLRVQDGFGEEYRESFIIDVNDVNEAPTDLIISNTELDENENPSFQIGSFTNEDQDVGDSHTYELVAGTGDDDNGAFQLSGSDLLATESFDFETKSDYSIRVQITDNEGLTYSEVFEIKVKDVNESPTAITVASLGLNENQGSNAFISTITASDPDNNETFSYTLVGGSGSEDNDAFTIANGNELRSSANFDFETKNSFSIRLRVTDSGNESFEQSFNVSVADQNDAPSDLDLSTSTIAENQSVGQVIGAFSVSDQDAADTHSFKLIEGDGDSDNGLFTINSNRELVTKSRLNHEEGPARTVRVIVTDASGASFQESFTISVTDLNDAPSRISLDNESLEENLDNGHQIGTLSVVDEDASDTHVLSLVSGTGSDDNDKFQISDDQLLTAQALDFEEQATYHIRVKAEDSSGATFESTFSISVENVNEAPSSVVLTNSQVDENHIGTLLLGYLSATDEDSNESLIFSLVSGSGDTHNNSFSIENGNELKATSTFDYESNSTLSIRVMVTDAGGLTSESTLSITVNDKNDSPTDMQVSAITVAENMAGEVVGSFTATDQDASDVHTFKLIEGDGDDSNALFTINSNGQLVTKSGLNFEEASAHSIRVITTDLEGATFQKIFTVSVTDANDAPTNISIDNVSLSENLGSGHEVGTLAITDEDAGDSHTLTLVSGDGSDDNTSFSISNGKLLTSTNLNFEEQSNFKIRIKAEDLDGATYESTFSINVENVNEAPGSLSLSKSFLNENSGANSVIGSLTATDEDASESLNFSLVSGTGDTDNASFSINTANELIASSSFDFENKSEYSVRIRVTDKGGLYTEKAYSVAVIDQNDSPTDMQVSASAVVENSTGVVIGSFSATDQDASDVHTFKLIEGEGDDSNALFTINTNSQLVTKSALNFEEASAHSIRVITTDTEGASFQKVFAISVTDVNDAPTEINLSQLTVLENLESGAEVGQVLVADEDVSDTHTLSFASGIGDSDNLSFSISDGKMLTQSAFDFESQSSYSVRLKAIDGQGEAAEQVLVITVLDDNDEPTAVSLSANKIAENSPAETPIGICAVTDQDVNSSYSYSLVAGAGDTDNDSFEFVGNQLVSKSVFDHETKEEYSIRVKASENGGNEIEAVFNIQVEDINESPTQVALSANSVAENSAGGTLVGNFSVNDPDIGDTYDYVLKNSVNDNLSFGINGGNQVVVAGELNFEEKNAYTITVEAIDQNGNRYEESFNVSITNAAEPGIAPSVESIDFGLINIGQGSSKDFEIFNDGPDGVLEITDFELPVGFSVSPNVATLNPGETLTFTLISDPEDEGEFEDEVKIISNAGEPIITVTGQAQLVAGLEDLPNISEEVKAYPNPAKDRLFIDASVFGNKPYTYQLIELSTGKMVSLKESNDEKTIEINTTAFNSGLYVIELYNDEKLARKKVLIIR